VVLRPNVESEMATDITVVERLRIGRYNRGHVPRVSCVRCWAVLPRSLPAEPDRPPRPLFKRLYARALGSTIAQQQQQAQTVRFPPLVILPRHKHARFAHVARWKLGGAQDSIGSAAFRERPSALPGAGAAVVVVAVIRGHGDGGSRARLLRRRSR